MPTKIAAHARPGKLKHVEKTDGWTDVVRSSTKRDRKQKPRRKVMSSQGSTEPQDEQEELEQGELEEMMEQLKEEEELQEERKKCKDPEAIWEFFFSDCYAERSIPPTPAENRDFTIDELNKHLERISRVWKASAERKHLLKTLKQREAVCGRVRKSVSLGLGDFAEFECLTNGSLVQLAVWLDMRDLIEGISEEDVKYYAQDPAFDTLDIEFLQQHGVEVLKHPKGLETVDESTFLYAPHFPIWSGRDAVVRFDGPMMAVNDLECWLERVPLNKAMVQKMHEMHLDNKGNNDSTHPAHERAVVRANSDLQIHARVDRFLNTHEKLPFIWKSGKDKHADYYSPFHSMNIYFSRAEDA